MCLYNQRKSHEMPSTKLHIYYGAQNYMFHSQKTIIKLGMKNLYKQENKIQHPLYRVTIKEIDTFNVVLKRNY